MDVKGRAALIHAHASAPPGPGRAFAGWVSLVGSPPILATVMILLGARLASTPSAWLWALAQIAAAVVAPSVYVLYLLARGEVTGLHIVRREERFRPFLASLSGATIAWAVTYLGKAPPILQTVAIATVVQTVVLFAITFWWKISIHAATAASLAVLACHLGFAGSALTVSVPMIAWSRVRLRHHTFMQTMAGAGVGGAVLLAALLLLG